MAKVSRREFIKAAAGAGIGAIGFPMFIPSSALGKAGTIAPSNRIVMGCIGTGNQGTSDINGFLQDRRVQIVAICDVNTETDWGYWMGVGGGRKPAKRVIESTYAQQTDRPSYGPVAEYTDFRELVARRDIDVVLAAVPDHWHALVAVAALSAGKDVYGEKPLALTVREGRAIADAVKKYGRIWQTGSQQRSSFKFRRLCELVRNGRLGKIHTVECIMPPGTPDVGKTAHRTAIEPVPAGLDWDMWLGPAPYRPFVPARMFVNYRWCFDYSGGQLTDWGGHHPDIAQWGLGTDHTGPVEFKNARAVYPSEGPYDTATDYSFEAIYKNGIKMLVYSTGKTGSGVKFIGTDGWMFSSRSKWKASDPKFLQEEIGPNEINLYKSDDHYRNFIDCVISRQEAIAPAEAAHRSITIAHLGNIAMKLGRDLKWDPEKEIVIGDEQANRMLARPMRGGWRI